MKKPIIITAFNDNPVYSSFVQYSINMWNNFGYNMKIGYISDEHDQNFIDSLYGNNYEIIKIDNVKGIDSGVQSKISRLILSSQEESFWIIDVDLFILNIKWYEDLLKQLNGYNILSHEKFNKKKTSKWPMSSNIGSGRLLKDIINPDNLGYYELIECWKNFENEYDKKEKITNEFKNFSDESLLRKLVLNSDLHNNFIFYKRLEPNLLNYHINSTSYYHDVMRRIDRHWAWSFNREKLYSGHYIDCQPRRPLNIKDPIIQEIFKYLNIR